MRLILALFLLVASAFGQSASFSAPPVPLGKFFPSETGPGYCSFTNLGNADLFILTDGKQIDVIVANGPLAASRGTVEGTLRIEANGNSYLNIPMTLHDGCAKVFRLGAKPVYSPPPWWIEFWTRHLPKDDTALLDTLKNWKTYTFDDSPYANPDQSGSARVCQYMWAGTLAAAFGIRMEDVRVGAMQWVDDQFDRPCLWYNESGGIMRAGAHPEIKVGQKGWTTPKRPSLSPRQLETSQHMAPDRMLAAAVAFNDLAGWMLLDAYTECVLTWPESKGALADDQRSHGYVVRTLALSSAAFGAKRPQFGIGLTNAIGGMTKAFGWAMGQPYPSRAPYHTGAWSHGYPGPNDGRKYFEVHGWEWLDEWDSIPTCDHLIPLLKQKALAEKFPEYYYISGVHGLWDYFRAVVVWQVGVELNALCVARDLGYPGLAPHIKHLAFCITGPGRATGLDSWNNPVVAVSVHDAYAAYVPGRVVKVSSDFNGTTTWLVAPLEMAAPDLGPGLRAAALSLASAIQTSSSYLVLSHPDGEAIETALPGLK